MKSKNKNNNNNDKIEKNQGSPAVDGEGFDLVKAAAWAWYERAHRNSSTAVKECDPRFFARKPSASVYRPSRFRAEASAEQKRGGSAEHDDRHNNNKAKRHSFDISRLSRSAGADFADEAEHLKRSVCNLDRKDSQGWDFGKSLLDSYEIVAIFKHVDNYAPYYASLPRVSEDRADLEAEPAVPDNNGNINANTEKYENINANAKSTVVDSCRLPSIHGRSMRSPTSKMAGVLQVGTAQKERYQHTMFSLNALSERLKSLADLRFVRLHHRDRKQHQHQHRHGHHRPYHSQHFNH